MNIRGEYNTLVRTGWIAAIMAGLLFMAGCTAGQVTPEPEQTDSPTITANHTPLSTITQTPSTTPGPTETSSASPTITLTAVTPEKELTPALSVDANMQIRYLGFYLDPSLGTEYSAQPFPPHLPGGYDRLSDPFTHFQVTFSFERVERRSYTQPRIMVIDTASAGWLDAKYNAPPIDALRLLLASRPTYELGWPEGGKGLPFYPYDEGGIQVIVARMAYMDFQNGTGVRYITALRGDAGYITNELLIYTYQGLTSDGRYYISAKMPLNHLNFYFDEDVPVIEDYDVFVENWMSYANDVTQTLNRAIPSEFTPSLDVLDALMQSIRIDGP